MMKKCIRRLLIISIALLLYTHVSLAQNLVAYYPFPFSIDDLSGNEHHGGEFGELFTAIDRFGNGLGAIYFDGIEDYIEVPFDALLNTEVFTITLWAKSEGNNGTLNSVISSREGGVFRGFTLYNDNNNEWAFWYGNNADWFAVTAGSVDLNEWVHLAIQYDGTDAKIYRNGVLAGSQTITYVPSEANPLRIGAGANEGAADFFFEGTIDDIRMYDGALSDLEIAEIYQAESIGQVAYYPLNGNTENVSGTSNDGIPLGGVFQSPDRFGNSGDSFRAVSFDGIDGHIDLGTTHFDFSTGLTFSVWANLSEPPTSWARFIDLGESAGLNNILFARNDATNNLTYQVYNGTDEEIEADVTAMDALAGNGWNNYTVTHGTDGSIIIYVNGIEVASGTGTLPATAIRGESYLGRSLFDSDDYFKGLMDEVRIYNRALSAEEVASQYQAEATSDLVADYSFSGDASDLSGNNYHGLVDGATLTTDRFSNENEAYFFNGGDNIFYNDTENLDLGDEITVAAWINSNDYIVGEPEFLSNLANGNGFDFKLSPTDSEDPLLRSLKAEVLGVAFISTGTLALDQWYHVAFTYKRNDALTLYLNGTEIGTIAVGDAPISTSSIGLRSGVDMNGTIDELTIYNNALSAAEIVNLYASQSGNPTLSSFSPTSGIVGTEVTIEGTHFSAVPAENVVKFNGLDAEVTSSTTVSTERYNVGGKGLSGFINFVNFGTEDAGGILQVGGAAFETPVEVRFGPGLSQMAHRFTVPEGQGASVDDDDYTYQDYVEVPFQVWDIDGNRQLMVSFRDQQRDRAFDLIEFDTDNADSNLQSREYVFVSSVTYSATVPNFNIMNDLKGHQFSNMYFFWPVLAAGADAWNPDALDPAEIFISYSTFLSTRIVANVPVGATTGQISVEVAGTELISNAEFTVTVDSVEPTAQATNLNFTTTTAGCFTYDFTESIDTNVTGYLHVFRESESPTFVPVDGTVYTPSLDTPISGSSFISESGDITDGSLCGAEDSEYFYEIYAYTGEGSEINYLTGTPLSGSITTVSLAVTDFTPLTGEVGTQVTITGTGFSTTAEENTIMFNGTAATITDTPTSTSIVTSIPVEATTGKITVTVDNQTVTSSIDFTVTTSNTDVEIIEMSFPTTYDKELTLTASITVNDATNVSSVNFVSKGISEPVSELKRTPIEPNATTFEIEIPASALTDEIGLVYYFEVETTSVETIITLIERAYLNYPDGEGIPELSFGTQVSNYQIIAVPLDLANKNVTSVFSELIPYDKTLWRLFDYNSGENREFGSGASSTIELGKGYWFIARNQTTINTGAGTTAQVTMADPFSITLTDGWNLIGNPYNFTISWDDVRQFNGDLDLDELGELKTFSNGTLTTSATLPSYQGGFVFRTGGTTTIQIPVTNTQGGRTNNEEKPTDLSGKYWELALELSQGALRNQLGGIGMHHEATLQGKDAYDEVSVPLIEGMGFFELGFSHPEFNAKFNKEVIPTTENYTWEFDVRRDATIDELLLSWNNERFGDNDRQLYLFNPVTFEVINMRSESSYEVGTNVHTLQIIFGNQDYIDKQLDTVVPLFGEPYPNPASFQISYPFKIPGSAATNVSLKVYDSTGKIIGQLDQEYHPGVHQLEWQFEHPGMYLLQLQMGETVKTTKIMVR